MSQLQILAKMTIHDGKLDAFKDLARQCAAIVREKDTGTLVYDWYFNSDETVCRLHEKYSSSDACLQHMSNVGDLLGILFGMCDISLEVHGTPSEQLIGLVSGMDVTLYDHFVGL